eukprot:5970518-Prymnesium_polylepis.2
MEYAASPLTVPANVATCARAAAEGHVQLFRELSRPRIVRAAVNPDRRMALGELEAQGALQ